jgi:predicted CxxxxCH...CXXCH cytochrome family protein
MTWTYVDPALVRPPTQQCAACHGYPPPPPHEPATGAECFQCHSSVAADGSIDVAAGRHLDGVLDVSGGGCSSCHGNPPASGAHLAHYGLEGGSGFGDLSTLQDRSPGETPTSAPQVYAFGCGNCHPWGSHRGGTVDVALYAPGAPAGSLMSKSSANAAYDATAGTCSGVYCHSSGQATPAYVTTPGWFSGATVGCAGCHANPPRYPSGGAGAATANSHLDLGDDGYEFGHFLGMPGPWHTSKHGENGWGEGEDAAPITCQTCHFDTTDPANTGPSGFYYLDTTGDYALPGGDPGRIAWGWQASIQCGSCHDGDPATGSGRVLPLRHVNGSRDVVFDARTTLPAIAWLPAEPDAPTAPYWMTGTGPSLPYPSWVAWSASGTTVSFDLATSTYDAATKTCNNVACHLAQTQPVWGAPYQYYTNQSATCYTCHPM